MEDVMASLMKIEGIGSVYFEKLSKVGIKTVEALLKSGASANGRKKLAADSGISETLILEWVNHADLWRIKGVSEEYSDLLEEAGVDTVVELAQRKPENLYDKMKEVNMSNKLVRRLPSPRQVADWVNQAKKFPRIVNY